nr:pentatricopeptide repeat-containing protein, mitochondrial [Quercus suber]
MWPLRRAFHPLKKQRYFLEASRVFCAEPDTSSNVRGDRASICHPSHLLSTRFLSVKLFHHTPILEGIFVCSRSLCSVADARSSSDSLDVEDGILEPETTSTVDVIEDCNVDEEVGEELTSEPGILDDDLFDTEKGVVGEESHKKKASLELCKAIMDAPSHSVASVLDKWLAEGNDLNRLSISKIIVSLRKRRMYGKTLQFSEWLETTKQHDLTEQDHAARLDLIAKVHGIQKAEKYIENIPKYFKGELVYRTLLTCCVHLINMKKAEAVFKKIRELEFPITIDACNQMIILYKRLDKTRIADILLLMEKENLKPSLFTYRLLLDTKGESNDIVGMEQLFETMKAEGVLPDIHVLAVLAKHYISGGLEDKAKTVLKEIEERKLKESLDVRRVLLPLYASLGISDDVDRIWKECELDPKMNECMAAIEAWGKLGEVEKAEAVFEMMLQKWKKLSSRHYSALLQVYVNHKLLTKGKEFVKRMGDIGSWVGPLTWDALVRLYLGAGDVDKADSILHKAVQKNKVRPLFNTYKVVMEEYANRGDIHNTEKLFHRMKQSGYNGRLKPHEILIRAYVNAKAPVYGFRERMRAENIFPNKAFAQRKQRYFLEASRVFCAEPDTSSNVRGDRASICHPSHLLSTRFLSVKLFHHTPILEGIFVCSRSLCSVADARSSSDSLDVEDGILEPETTSTVDVIEDCNVDEEVGEELTSEPGILDDDLFDTEKGVVGEESHKKKASLELCKAIMDAPSHSVASVLDKWLAEGNDLNRLSISKIIVSLRKRRMYGKTLQFSEWLETTKQHDLTEQDHAARLDLIAKVHGIQKAEKYIENIPKYFKGELVYRTLLTCCVHLINMKKAEAVFKKIRELEFPITIDACNQMIILYKRLDKTRIADILLLMEKENLKPSLFTYRLLLDTKGESNDIVGMEQLFETMKAEGVLPDIHVLAVLAKHYISGGLEDKAKTVLKEIEERKLKESLDVRRVLLPLYASLGISDDVDRIWKECELDPKMNECMAAIEAWGKLGEVEKAEAVFEMMLQKWKKLSSRHYSALLQVYVNHKLLTKGKEFVKRMGDIGSWVGPLTWDALVRLYLGAGDVDKADSILHKAVQKNKVRPLFNTYKVVMEEYANRGDIHNTEKLFHRMKQSGYNGRLKPHEILIRAYINAKAPVYGFRERMRAENIFPNKAFAQRLAQADPFRKR